MLFIYYCEDHPQHFIEDNSIEDVANAAVRLPGGSQSKVYEYLKAFFREVDTGSPAGSGMSIPAYNGELFKDHPIIDHVELPDSLHKKVYHVDEPTGVTRKIRGVWGLHGYNFWEELNEHLLGHIFEVSLSDLNDLGTADEKPFGEKLAERKREGIYYTTSILSDFLCESALQAFLGELAPIKGSTNAELIDSLENRLGHLLRMRAVDFACGSGAFLVSIYREMLQEFYRLRSSLDTLYAKTSRKPIDLYTIAESTTQAGFLRNCIFGVDKLPQAVEIAKLALWLRSARKDEKVLDLSGNLVAADSLDVPGVFARLGASAGSYDLVIGNPPWGSDIGENVRNDALRQLDLLQYGTDWDSWELFVLLSLRALRPGGRLALVLPDSFFYPKKARLRRLLFAFTTPEKVHSLGPDWFGKDVRMNTIVLQARRGDLDLSANIRCMVLAGVLRARAAGGEVPLTQIETQRGRFIPVQRVAQSPTWEVEVFRGLRDDQLMDRMLSRSRMLSGTDDLRSLCERGRGEEMNKFGLYWICPSCLTPTTPGKKKKGGGYLDKLCMTCGCTLTSAVETDQVVSAGLRAAGK